MDDRSVDPVGRDDGDTPTPHARDGVPDWDDEYVDRVADRLMHSYDLERDMDVRGEVFDLYGEMRIERQKQLFHPSINYANHSSEEYLFARRTRVRRTDIDSLVDFGHALADEWIETDETHYSTDFTFVLVAPEITDTVREYVAGFRDRTLIKLGFRGHYEVNLTVVAPEEQDIVKSKNADVGEAFTLWSEPKPEGLLDRFVENLRS
jgi:hypothetical protein